MNVRIDTLKLYTRQVLESHYRKLETAHEARVRRQTFLANIVNKAEDGKVAVVWSGMDCDGSAYSGSVNIVPATVKAVDDHIDETYRWADGPCHFYITSPSAAQGIKHQSRDLALEAFENGHPHLLCA